MEKNRYLIKNRLCEVLALIQVLALDKHGHRSEDGLKKELSEKPISGISWQEIASQHSEFFRVDPTNKWGVSLVSRHVTELNEAGKRDLSADFIKKLLETAIELYNIQKEESKKWNVWIPVIVVVISTIANILVTIFHKN